jgi:hypothetical protein
LNPRRRQYSAAAVCAVHGPAAFAARLDPDRVKERQLHDAIFREERGDLFAVRDAWAGSDFTLTGL